MHHVSADHLTVIMIFSDSDGLFHDVFCTKNCQSINSERGKIPVNCHMLLLKLTTAEVITALSCSTL